jgi:hypothetical protein
MLGCNVNMNLHRFQNISGTVWKTCLWKGHLETVLEVFQVVEVPSVLLWIRKVDFDKRKSEVAELQVLRAVSEQRSL